MEMLKPVDTRIFSKNQILWRGRYKLLGSGAEALAGLRAIDSVEADFVLGAACRSTVMVSPFAMPITLPLVGTDWFLLHQQQADGHHHHACNQSKDTVVPFAVGAARGQ